MRYWDKISYIILLLIAISNSEWFGIEKTVPYNEKIENLLFYFEHRGINNHILGVRKAISLGIELNRTVVILPFSDGHIPNSAVFKIYHNFTLDLCSKNKVYIGIPDRNQQLTRYWKFLQDKHYFFSNYRANIRYLEDLPQFHNITLDNCVHSQDEKHPCIRDYVYSNEKIICIIDAYFIHRNPHGSYGVQLFFSEEVIQTGISLMKKFDLRKPYLGVHWRRGDFANRSYSSLQIINQIKQYSNYSKVFIITNERNPVILNEIKENISQVIIRNSENTFDTVVDMMIVVCAAYSIFTPGSSLTITSFNLKYALNNTYICSEYYGGI